MFGENDDEILNVDDNLSYSGDIKELSRKYNMDNLYRKEFKKYCPDYDYMPSIYGPTKRIVVVGDLHGDLGVTIKSLKVAGVINDKNEWIGGDTIIVQVGDQLDRCRPGKYKCKYDIATANDESDIAVLKFMTSIHNKAKKKGGAVISLLGNHELMNVEGHMDYVSFTGFKDFGGSVEKETDELGKDILKADMDERIKAFKPGNEMAKYMSCTRLSAVIIGSTLFAHAGVLPEFIKDLNMENNEDITALNFIVSRWLLGKINKNYVEKIVGSSNSNSVFWNRILGNIPSNIHNEHKDCAKYVMPVLNTLKVNHMIIGHTPQFHANQDGINKTCDKGLWRVDNGASSAFDGFDHYFKMKQKPMDQRQVQVLEILDDNQFNILK